MGPGNGSPETRLIQTRFIGKATRHRNVGRWQREGSGQRERERGAHAMWHVAGGDGWLVVVLHALLSPGKTKTLRMKCCVNMAKLPLL